MSTPREELTTRFARSFDAVVAVVEQLDEAGMATFCPPEQCTAAALACHVAEAETFSADIVQSMVAGLPMPHLTMDDIHRMNAERATVNADVGKDEVLSRLRATRAKVMAVLGDLNDEDLERTATFSLAGAQAVSVRFMIENGLEGQSKTHLPSLQAAAG